MENLQNLHRVYFEFSPDKKYSFTNERFDGEYKCISELVRRGVIKRIGRGEKARYERGDATFYPSIKWLVSNNPGITKQRLLELKCNKQTLNGYISKKNLIVHNDGLYIPGDAPALASEGSMSKMFNELLMPVRAKWVGYGRNA